MKKVIKPVNAASISRLLSSRGFCRCDDVYGTPKSNHTFWVEEGSAKGTAIVFVKPAYDSDNSVVYASTIEQFLSGMGYEVKKFETLGGYVGVSGKYYVFVSGKYDEAATIEVAKSTLWQSIAEAREVLGGQIDSLLVAALQGKQKF